MANKVLMKDGLVEYHQKIKQYISDITSKFLSEITATDISNALGYTPASSTVEVPLFTFSIVDGNLIAYYPDGSTAPNFYIDGNGHLLYISGE